MQNNYGCTPLAAVVKHNILKADWWIFEYSSLTSKSWPHLSLLKPSARTIKLLAKLRNMLQKKKMIFILIQSQMWQRLHNVLFTKWHKASWNESPQLLCSLTWITKAYGKKKKRWRKITCNNLSLQSCGGTAAVFLYLSLSASRLRIWEGGGEMVGVKCWREEGECEENAEVCD